MSTGTITTWGSCDPTANGYQTAKDSITGPSGEQLTEVENISGVMTWKRTNVWIGNDLIATYNATGLHFFFNDWLGTRRVQTDYAGNVQLTCASLPYGDGKNCASLSDAASAGPDIYAGIRGDSASGLDEGVYRDYSPTFGAWTTPDPDDGSYNLAGCPGSRF